MAPSYTPNKIPGMALPSSLLKYEEPQQLQDIMHMQALQRAQELQTQQAEIATQQKQQAFDRQNQIREQIQSRFTDGGDADLDNALGIIQASALEAGDYETALNVEKSRKMRRGDDLAPLTPEQRMYYQVPEDAPISLTMKDLMNKSNLDRASTYAKSIEDAQNRYEDKTSRFLPEGYYGNPTSAGAERFKKTLSGYNEAEGILNRLDESIARSGTEELTGDEYVNQRQLVASLASVLKSPAFGNLGAALSPGEWQLLLAELPQLMSTPGTNVGRILVERGLGRDPRIAIQALREKIRLKLDSVGRADSIWRVGEEKTAGGPDVDAAIQRGVQSQLPQAPFQVPNAQFQGVDQATGLPIFKRGR